MLESLRCNSCGAPMEVPANANYVKCNHCDAQLVVHRERDMTFTEAMDKLNETTQSLSDQVSRLNVNQQMAELDRRWEIQRNDYRITGKDGHSRLPTEGAAMVGGIFAVIFGTFWTVMAFAITSASPFAAAKIFPLFGLLFIGGGIFSAIHARNKASDYKRAKRRYESERDALARRTR